MGKTSPFARRPSSKKALTGTFRRLKDSKRRGRNLSFSAFCSVIAFLLLIETVSKRKKGFGRCFFCPPIRAHPKSDVWRADECQKMAISKNHRSPSRRFPRITRSHGSAYFRLPRIEVFCRRFSLSLRSIADNSMFSSFDSRNILASEKNAKRVHCSAEIEMLKASRNYWKWKSRRVRSMRSAFPPTSTCRDASSGSGLLSGR